MPRSIYREHWWALILLYPSISLLPFVSYSSHFFPKAPIPGYGQHVFRSPLVLSQLLLFLLGKPPSVSAGIFSLQCRKSDLFLFQKPVFSLMFIFMLIFHGSPSPSDICPIFISVISKTSRDIFYNFILLFHIHGLNLKSAVTSLPETVLCELWQADIQTWKVFI